MIRHITVFCFIFGLAFFLPMEAASSKSWLKNKYKVKQVLSGDRFAVDYQGINLVVKLVGVKVSHEDKARKELESLIKGKRAIIVPEELAGITDSGLQQVYAFIGDGQKRIFVNDHLIQKEVAQFVDGPSLQFKKFMNKMRESSLRHQPPEKKLDKTQIGGFCSELHSKKYHLVSCKWSKLMNEQNRIIYDSTSSAERVGKTPCYHCLYSRVKEIRLKRSRVASSTSKRLSKGPARNTDDMTGYLFGNSDDNYFYSPVSKKLPKFKNTNLIRFNSLKEALSSGRKADMGSLRINNPVVPKPVGKECIGRSLPYMRPCRRETTHPTRLCEPCLNGRIR